MSPISLFLSSKISLAPHDLKMCFLSFFRVRFHIPYLEDPTSPSHTRY